MPDGSLGVGDDYSGDSGRGTGQEQSEAEQLAAAGAHVTGSSTAMEGVVALGGEGSCCKIGIEPGGNFGGQGDAGRLARSWR